MWRPLPAVAAAVCVGLLAATAAGVWLTRRDAGVQLRAGTTRQAATVTPASSLAQAETAQVTPAATPTGTPTPAATGAAPPARAASAARPATPPAPTARPASARRATASCRTASRTSGRPGPASPGRRP
jgi:multifunctional 2-oxoglutarate metabolism enzyme